MENTAPQPRCHSLLMAVGDPDPLSQPGITHAEIRAPTTFQDWWALAEMMHVGMLCEP